ncbi:hypothetical protein IT087_01370 [Candidatus Uhrbacteria bacterium]|nr:hypothetical protein [Candidatus Uhrbacteria bacterium]
MQEYWSIIGGIVLVVLGFVGAIVVYIHLRHSRNDHNFNEFLLGLVLYELGHAEDSSMSLALLKRIMPCDPDFVDDLLAGLEDRRQIEFFHEDRELRVRMSTRLYLLFATGNWRRVLKPEAQRRFEEELAQIRSRLELEPGARPV